MGVWEIDDVTERFAAMADEFGEITAARTLSGSRRHGFAVATLSLAMEHFDAIAILTKMGRCGSAAALVRPLVDAATRGAWLAVAATEDQAERFADDDQSTTRKAMLTALESVPGLDAKVFQVDPATWKHLHGLTHGGFNQASHRLRDGVISGTYRPEFIDGMLKHSLSVGAGTTVVLGTLLGVDDVRRRVFEVLARYAWYASDGIHWSIPESS